MAIDPKIIDAENLVEAKRAKLMTSVKYGVGEAKRRLAPDLLAEQAWEKTKAKAADSAHDALVAAKNNPWLVGGIGAAIGLFLARGAIGDAVRGGVESLAGHFGEEPAEERAKVDAEPAPETPVAVAKQAKERKVGAAKSANKTPAPTKRNSKTEDVK